MSGNDSRPVDADRHVADGHSNGEETLSSNETWNAGVATTTITPTEPLRLAGYASRTDPADGVETDLHARALAISEDGEETVVLVSVEVISIPPAVRRALERRCAERYGLSPESLAFTATHTHSGPILGETRCSIYGLSDEESDAVCTYRDRLVDSLVDTVGAALDDRAPATLEYSHARCGFAMNRRRPTPEGIANAPHPDGPVDHDVPVLAVRSGGDLRAVAFGYACHATTLQIDRYCGDWPGYAMAAVEERHPEATALFLTGCAGDQNPYPRRSIDVAKHQGQAMAYAVETALKGTKRPVRGPLQVEQETVQLSFEGYDGRQEVEQMLDVDDPYRRRHAQLVLEQIEETGELRTTFPYRMQAIGFGTDLTMLLLEGEVVVDYALELKANHSGPLWVAGYTNDGFTYVPTRQMLAEGGYEGGGVTRFRRYPGPLEPTVERRILASAGPLARRVGGTRA